MTTLGFGGTERNLVQYCETLNPKKWKIEVWFLYEQEESMRGRLEANGTKVIHLGNPSKFRPLQILSLCKKLATSKADLIHIFLPTVGYYAVVSKLVFRSKIPMIFSSGGVQFLLPLQRFMMKYGIGRYCYPIVCNSHAVKQFWKDMGVELSRLRVIRNGHDLARIKTPLDRETFRASLNIHSDEILITTVGRLIDTKRHTDILQALAKLDQTKFSYRMLIVGDGPLREQIKSEINERNLSERVILTGRRDDVISILKSSDLFVFPSASEGLPNALIEAALCKVPIVASDINPVLEIITNGDSGRIFPVTNVQKLATAIEESLTNLKLSGSMADAAYRKASRDFDLGNTIDLLQTAYQDAINY